MTRARAGRAGVLWIVVGFLLPVGGCDRAAGPESIPWDPPRLAAPDGLLEEDRLQEVVDLQVARDGDALRALLSDPSGAVRARAAFALASVQDPAALTELAALSGDPDPDVRKAAAFAIGRLDGADLPREELSLPLLEALAGEDDPSVRLGIVEALGLAGDATALSALVEGVPASDRAMEAARTLAVSRLGIHELEHPELPRFLAERLRHDDPAVRKNAAYYFGRAAIPDPWAPVADDVREALDGYAMDDPAAMHLLVGLWQLQEPADRGRAAWWLEEARDWRIRVNAARTFDASAWLEDERARDAVFRALDDPSIQVALAAAEALASPFSLPPDVLERAREWIERNPDRWPVAAPFLDALVLAGEQAFVLRWGEEVSQAHPLARVPVLRALAMAQGEDADRFLFEAARSEDPIVRGQAVAVLRGRWRGARDMDELELYYGTFADAVRSGEPYALMEGAEALKHPSFHAFGSLDVMEEAYREHRPRGVSPRALGELLVGLGESGDPDRAGVLEEAWEDENPVIRAHAALGLQMLIGQDLPLTTPEEAIPIRPVEWASLQEWGSRPRLVLETDRGRVVLRLAAEEAPQTVSGLLHLAEQGRFDGTRFHRVVPNFVAQGGDVGEGDGLGGPGFRVRTELTRIPFVRGTVGMASSGRDTEGSQFYLAHSAQPHLEAGYAAVGWVEEGMEVVDALREGDRIREARPERAGGG